MKFDTDKLSNALQSACPGVIFAFLHGSAKDGCVNPGSDIDIALYLSGAASLEIYTAAADAVRQVSPDAEPDIGILNNAEPIYRFEALKGKLLFSRDMETYLYFFSLTCREYESQIADYQRQHKYRLQAAN
ncbi:MAG: nucleotidyltransferase domain-containing protein [Planctomycetes bacterium]|nr:nucleotidyltransferase domain-containing protein [Planctomycetota bacterium]